MVGNVWEHSIMADYNPLPAPQFSYTKQLEAYDELLRKRKNKQKWGTIFNNIDAMSNANHVASGAFARNEKRIAGSYGASLSQESKRLSLLGQAEKEGIHQEISKRLQDATKKYSMASKSDFDSWFETLGPHFAGEYKTYFDIWNAGVKAEVAEEDLSRKRIKFTHENNALIRKAAKDAREKAKADDLLVWDNNVSEIYLANEKEYGQHWQNIHKGWTQSPKDLESVRDRIRVLVQSKKDWSPERKVYVMNNVWEDLQKGVSGSSTIPTQESAEVVSRRLDEDLVKSKGRMYAYAVSAGKKLVNEKRFKLPLSANLEDFRKAKILLEDGLRNVEEGGATLQQKDIDDHLTAFVNRYPALSKQNKARLDATPVGAYRLVIVKGDDGSWTKDLYTNANIKEAKDSGKWGVDVRVPTDEAASHATRPPWSWMEVGLSMALKEKDIGERDKKRAILAKIGKNGILESDLSLGDFEFINVVIAEVKKLKDARADSFSSAIMLLNQAAGNNPTRTTEETITTLSPTGDSTDSVTVIIDGEPTQLTLKQMRKMLKAYNNTEAVINENLLKYFGRTE